MEILFKSLEEVEPDSYSVNIKVEGMTFGSFGIFSRKQLIAKFRMTDEVIDQLILNHKKDEQKETYID